MKIEHTSALVTGANRGLGRALVEALLARGARRVYATARDVKTLEELRAQAPERIVPLSLDVTDVLSLKAAAEQVPELDLLINNAGVLTSYDLLESSTEALVTDFNTNAVGMVNAVKALLPALERAAARGPGRAALVNVLSVVSLGNIPSFGGYSASKAAALSLTQALRPGLTRRGIRVHAALPGTIDTDMVRAFDVPKTSPQAVARGILEGVEQDVEDIAPDPISLEVLAKWRRDPKAVEQQFAGEV